MVLVGGGKITFKKLLGSLRKPVYIVGHNDVDGFGAHALLERKLAGRKVIHHFLDYANLEETFSKIENLKDSEIFFADLNVTSRTGYVYKKLQKMHKNGNRMKWDDHHDWSKKNFEMFSEVLDELTLERGICTTEIIQKKYLPHDAFAVRLAAAAHESDFDEKNDVSAHRLAMYLQDVIAYADILDMKNGNDNEKSGVAGKLARGILNDEKIETFYWKYRPIKETAMLEIEKTLTHLKVNGYDACFALTPEELPRKMGISRIIERGKNADINVGVMPSGRIFVRTFGEVPEGGLLKMVKPFDGGGRGRMGGGLFKYGEPVSKSNYKEVFGLIAGKMSEALASYVEG